MQDHDRDLMHRGSTLVDVGTPAGTSVLDQASIITAKGINFPNRQDMH
jgi:hypothetical protein